MWYLRRGQLRGVKLYLARHSNFPIGSIHIFVENPPPPLSARRGLGLHLTNYFPGFGRGV